MDKGLTAQFLSENGVMTPKTWNTVEECEKDFPIIVKERFGCGSHFVVTVNDEYTLAKTFTAMDNLIVQECVGGDDEEYTLTIFSNGKVINHIVFKRQLGFGGMGQYVEFVHNNELTRIAKKVAQISDLHGSINIQMRKHGEKNITFLKLIYAFQV